MSKTLHERIEARSRGIEFWQEHGTEFSFYLRQLSIPEEDLCTYLIVRHGWSRPVDEVGRAEEIFAILKDEYDAKVSGPWSEADTPQRWAKLFGISSTTFKRHAKSGKIRVKELSDRSYQVHVDDVPKRQD